MREKAWSTPIATIHQRPETCHLGMRIVHNWFRKWPYALCKSCRGSRDLQLRYRSLWVLQFEFLEKLLVKVGQSEMFWHQRSRARAERRRCALPRSTAVAPGPRRRGGLPPAGPCAALVEPPSRPCPPAPRVARPVATLRRPCRRPPNRDAAVPDRARRRTPHPCHGHVSRSALQATTAYKRQ
jgi:hypothetical protein